jgi:hypothetical protein
VSCRENPVSKAEKCQYCDPSLVQSEHAGRLCIPVAGSHPILISTPRSRICRPALIGSATNDHSLKRFSRKVVPITVIWGAPHSDDHTIEHEFIPFHGELMSTGDEINPVRV